MNRGLAVIVAALVFAAIVGAVAYNVGVSSGIEQSGKIVAAPAPAGAPAGPYPYPYYGWHPYGWHPWGFGFFLFPLFFFAFWFLIIRGIFWGGGWRRRHGYRYGFDEWHRQAHERMNQEPRDGAQV
ncbi:MAG TPA: hypothetical protein VF980_05895 [Thermoanaerobaculia bacterium]